MTLMLKLWYFFYLIWRRFPRIRNTILGMMLVAVIIFLVRMGP